MTPEERRDMICDSLTYEGVVMKTVTDGEYKVVLLIFPHEPDHAFIIPWEDVIYLESRGINIKSKMQ
jgi:hypothetical protein